ncbi:hypothetical protein [Bradyrhizobium oligotrophicum]|uniref:hypothetical protein n=1 Tax=Bradyrhizobium oligotrophicum TaxID=44255 RepID=UPI001360B3D5|nr:hypothetical protein [Bradyrhizobium oligotrophicum]
MGSQLPTNETSNALVKKLSCYFSETMIIFAHPASTRGALRAIVTTREAGSDGRGLPQRVFGRADERLGCGREVAGS